MDPPGRHKQTRCISKHRNKLWANPDRHRKTWCNSEHIGVGTLRQTQQTRCLGEHRVTELGPSKQKRCKGEHIPDWTLQADTYRRGALVSTNTDFGPMQTDTALVGPYRPTDVALW